MATRPKCWCVRATTPSSRCKSDHAANPPAATVSFAAMNYGKATDQTSQHLQGKAWSAHRTKGAHVVSIKRRTCWITPCRNNLAMPLSAGHGPAIQKIRPKDTPAFSKIEMPATRYKIHD
jgi:hypothetical protein